MTKPKRPRGTKKLDALSRRERQIMDSVYRRGSASCAEIREDLIDPPSYSAVRALVATLEDKGLVRHAQVDRKYVYRPTVPADQARTSALRRVLDTFFDGSIGGAVSALLDLRGESLSDQQLDEVERQLRARKGGRRRQ